MVEVVDVEIGLVLLVMLLVSFIGFGLTWNHSHTLFVWSINTIDRLKDSF